MEGTMKTFWYNFMLGFAALFVFFPFTSSNLQNKNDGISESWENVGTYLRKALNGREY